MVGFHRLSHVKWTNRSQRHEGICAGKQSVAGYLIERHGFVHLQIARTVSLPVPQSTASEHTVSPSHRSHETLFNDIYSMLEFVTERWKERWVTTDIWNETILKSLLRRPSFIFISVDAPVSLRWQRYKER